MRATRLSIDRISMMSCSAFFNRAARKRTRTLSISISHRRIGILDPRCSRKVGRIVSKSTIGAITISPTTGNSSVADISPARVRTRTRLISCSTRGARRRWGCWLMMSRARAICRSAICAIRKWHDIRASAVWATKHSPALPAGISARPLVCGSHSGGVCIVMAFRPSCEVASIIESGLLAATKLDFKVNPARDREWTC